MVDINSSINNTISLIKDLLENSKIRSDAGLHDLLVDLSNKLADFKRGRVHLKKQLARLLDKNMSRR